MSALLIFWFFTTKDQSHILPEDYVTLYLMRTSIHRKKRESGVSPYVYGGANAREDGL